MVVNLAEGGPAATALLPGDILLELAGTAVSTPRNVSAALAGDRSAAMGLKCCVAGR